MRLLVTADLHYNHARSRPSADAVIDEMDKTPHDGILLVGDTAILDGDTLEQCLARFSGAGPKLFVPGNHELWTAGPNSLGPLSRELPDRVRAAGWHWLAGSPMVFGDWAVVGNIGWYDYS